MVVSAIGILVAAAVAIGIHMHTGRRAKKLRAIDARADFRAAFAETLLYLGGGRLDDETIFARTADAQEKAIALFKDHIRWWKRCGFDRACDNYREARKYAQDQSQMKCFRIEDADKLRKIIEKLLSYAK